MWDFFETVRHRHSVRKYRSDIPVEPEKLHAVLETATSAPSAGDLQSYHIHVIKDPATRKALGEAAEGQGFVGEAPIALVFSADPQRAAHKYGERGRDLYALQDATIAASYAQLAAVAAGLATAWVGFFDTEQVRKLAKLPADHIPLAIVTLGYAAELPEITPRRHLDEVITRI